jgi:hypothetical protein
MLGSAPRAFPAGRPFINDFEAYDQSPWQRTKYRDIAIDNHNVITLVFDVLPRQSRFKPFHQIMYSRLDSIGRTLTRPTAISDSAVAASFNWIHLGANRDGKWVAPNLLREACPTWPRCSMNMMAWMSDSRGDSITKDISFGGGVPLPNDNQLPAAAVDSSGAFVICWVNNKEPDGSSVWCQLFGSNGTPASDTIRVSGDRLVGNIPYSDCRDPKVAATLAGDFVVTWDVLCPTCVDNGRPKQVLMRLYDRKGKPRSEVLCASCTRDLDPTQVGGGYPDIAMTDNGNFAITWRLFRDNCRSSIFLKRFNADGSPKAVQATVDSGLCGLSVMSYVVSDSIGNLVVDWQDDEGDENGLANLKARRYSPDGLPIGDEYQVNDGYKNVLFVSSPLAMNCRGLVGFYWAEIRFSPDDSSGTQHDMLQLMDLQDVGVYLPGDANNDHAVDLRDVAFLLNYLFSDGQPPANIVCADATGDGRIDWADVVSLKSRIR